MVQIVTLGCRINSYESEVLKEKLSGLDNLIIVNTCAVTGEAERQCRQTIRKLRRENPDARIVVTGCAAQVAPQKFAEMPEVDLVLGNREKAEIEKYISAPLEEKTIVGDIFNYDSYDKYLITGFEGRQRAFVQIQQGCNHRCTYCIVPYARGRERSRDVEEIMADFKQLLEAGFHEIVITGVNVCNYNCGGLDLVGLLEKLIAVEGDFRIRLGSTEPGEILPRVIDLMASTPKICDFLHLPLQAGTDEILKAMGRKYTLAEYKSMIDCARSKMPHIHIGSDLIVGFPGETAELFEQSCEFVKSMHFANLHVFPFSPRKGTKAEKLPGRIPVEEMVRRVEATKPIKAACAAEFAKSLIGTELSVLFERTLANNGYEGWSSNYVKVRTRSQKSILKEIHTVKVNAGNDENILSGKLMN